ncbi:PepSY-associated TM helix domain-containing protein [Fodinibius halophilus]|uniref:PepSY domain-containing protein n=1 Tax=Fodinibius halophilus TaxID=1736908 RepID=A0A6M1TGD0_9BACT|nr:PepSY-associated TM helix domain-containing protein [Fodinibius halophilus]NGP87710.1 PepSY domain-containing protein [Fodinibius halophilus]
MVKQNLLSIHKWLGLLAGIFILIMGISGSIIVFDDEIDDLINHEIITQPNSTQPVSVDKAYSSIVNTHPNWEIRFTNIPEQANRVIEAEIRRPNDRRYLYLHPVSGKILLDKASKTNFTHWMLKLHYSLHAGVIGETILFVAALMFIGSLITGIWFYRKAIWRVCTFKIYPRFRDLKSTSSELHRTIGVWALLFNFITALTGTIILFTIVSAHLTSKGPEPIPDPPSINVSIDSLLNKAVESYPGFDPSYLMLPKQEGGTIRFYGHTDTDWPIHYRFSNYLQFNPNDGTLVHAFFIKDKPIEMHLLSFIYPLHFGNWGGIIIKILYSLFGIAPAILSITGFIIWQKRNSKKKTIKQNRQKERLAA